jgi:hypothetical protein
MMDFLPYSSIALYAMSSLAGAAMYNPTTSYIGTHPVFGIYLRVGHPLYFYMILVIICGFHLAFIVVVAVLTKKVNVGPENHLTMGLLLKPVTDTLEGHQNLGNGKEMRDLKM